MFDVVSPGNSKELILAVGPTHLLLLAVVFFVIALIARRQGWIARRSQGQKMPSGGTGKMTDWVPWTSIQNLAAILGIVSFIIQIFQWMHGR
jgi:hypothetical protein